MAFSGIISVGLPSGELANLEDALSGIPNGARIATYTAINDTMRSEKTDLNKRLREIVNLPAAEVRDRIQITKIATQDNLSGELTLDYRAVPLRKFKPRYRRGAGVTVQTLLDKPAQAFAWMFAGKIPNAAKAFVFARVMSAAKVVPKHGRYAGRILKRGPNKGKLMMRQPIRETFGVSVLKALESRPELIDQVAADTEEKFASRLRSKLDWLLENPNAATGRKARHI